MWFKKEFSICLIVFEAMLQAISVQKLRESLEQHGIHSGYPKMHLVSNISESILRIWSGNTVATDISEWIHIGNVKVTYWQCERGILICWQSQIHLTAAQSQRAGYQSSIYAGDTVVTCPLRLVWYWLSKSIQPTICCRYLVKYSQSPSYKPPALAGRAIFPPISQQVYHLRETHLHGVCRSIKLTSLQDASLDCINVNIGQLFHAQMEEYWGHEGSGLVLGYDQNVLIGSIVIKLQNGLLYYHQPFHCAISVEHLGPNCKVKYTNGNQGIMSQSHNIWVQHMESNIHNTFQCQVPAFPVWYICWTPLKQILPFQKPLPAGKTISTLSKRSEKIQQWILYSQAQEYAVVI